MIRAYSVAVYPSAHFDEQLPVITSYIQMAKRYGCTEIFSSGHLPEFSLPDQLLCLEKLSHIVHLEQLVFTVDLGGSCLYEILHDEQLKNLVKKLHIDYLRLDYGYEPSFMIQCVRELGIHGIIWNASIMKLDEIAEHWKIAKQIPNLKIRACHNFYPRPESGLDEAFVKEQNGYFHQYSISVTTCIPSFTCPRGPLMAGLPTIECHRSMPMEKALLTLIKSKAADEILIGDEFISEREFQILYAVLQKQPLTLHVHLYADLSQQEEQLLLDRIHHIRYDSNSFLLRSQSSRQMAEFADVIPPHHIEERKAGCITMDNKDYLRYSGEIQFILEDLPMDKRVNIIGTIDEQDLWKLDYYRDGFDYQLIKC